MGQHGQSSLQCLKECLLLLRASLGGREREQWEEVEGQRGGDRREGEEKEEVESREWGWGGSGRGKVKEEGEGGEELIRMEERWRGITACNLPSAHVAQMFFPTAVRMRNGCTCPCPCKICILSLTRSAVPVKCSTTYIKVPCHRRC